MRGQAWRRTGALLFVLLLKAWLFATPVVAQTACTLGLPSSLTLEMNGEATTAGVPMVPSGAGLTIHCSGPTVPTAAYVDGATYVLTNGFDTLSFEVCDNNPYAGCASPLLSTTPVPLISLGGGDYEIPVVPVISSGVVPAGPYAGDLFLSVEGATGPETVTSGIVSLTVNVTESCTFGALDYGMYFDLSNIGSTEAQAATVLDVTCTTSAAGDPFLISASSGLYATGSTRRMAQGSDFVEYGLFKDLSHTDPLGDGVSFGTQLSGSALGGTVQGVMIYGLVPVQVGVPTGTFTDMVVLSITL